MTVHYLGLDEILRLHFKVIEDFGGSHGVRDEGRLGSVELAPRQIAFATEQYPTIFKKAAVYFRNIIGDHSFIDGNKRTAVTVCGIFLARNGYSLTATSKELEDFTLAIAIKHLGIQEIARWLAEKSK